MSSDEKRWIILLIAVLIIGGIILGAFIKSGGKKNNTINIEQQVSSNNNQTIIELDDGTRINTDKELTSTKSYNNLEISNIQFTEKDGITTLYADVKNIGNTKHEVEIVKLTILDKSGNILAELNPIIGEINPGETIKLDASITSDVLNAKNIKIESKK